MTDQPNEPSAPTPTPPPAVPAEQDGPGVSGRTETLYATAPRTNTLAVVSFVSAFFVSLAAIITGHIALAQIRARGEAGRGLAIAGLVLGYVGLAILAALIAVAVLFAAVFGTFVSSLAGPVGSAGSSNSAPGDQVLEGTVGAAHFDDGYLELGSGPVVVDVYFDVLCPFCKAFDDTNGAQLALAVDNDAITLRLHSLTFLDRASAGTDYSSRASSALTCQATMNPEGTLGLLAALYANQPAENTAGLRNTDLIDLAATAAPAGRSIADCVGSPVYQAWSQQNTERAFTGPIDATDITMIEGTPTVLVDGLVYPGSITDAEQFNAFVSAAF